MAGQRAFDPVKKVLIKAPVMVYYDLNLPTIIATDVLPLGLCAILEANLFVQAENSHPQNLIIPNLNEKPWEYFGHVKSSNYTFLEVISKS